MKNKKTRKPRLLEGLPVIDAKEPLTITVLDKDIKTARKSDPSNCAAANAGKRELHKDVRVFLTRTYIKEKKHWVRYITSEAASREIIAFDRGSAFCPGEYKLNPVPESQKIGIYRGIKTSEKGRIRNRPRHVTANVREWRDRK